jgi:hypothetical protein
VIAGTVRDGDGEPLAKATVTVYRIKYEDGRRRIVMADGGYTDDLGQYRIAGLIPGKYYVKSDPEQKPLERNVLEGSLSYTADLSDDGQPRQKKKAARPPEVLLSGLAPGVRDTAAARVVDVEAGARVMGADVVLQRSRIVTVKGRATAPPGLRISGVQLIHGRPGTDPLQYSYSAEVDRDGNFEFGQVTPGSYLLTAMAGTVERASMPLPSGDGQQMFFVTTNSTGGAACHEQIPVEVGASNVEGVRVVLSAGGEVAGTVTVEGKDKPDSLSGQVVFENGEGEPLDTEIGPTGAFKTRLCSGRYTVIVQLGAQFLVHSIRSAGRDVLAEGMTISGPGSEPLDIVLGSDGGRVDGVVLDADDKPVAGATVVLVPEAKLRSRASRFRQTETDQYGRYELKDIPPGDYRLFAWEDVELGIWYDPEFLKAVESKGQVVTIQPNGHESSKPHVIATAR